MGDDGHWEDQSGRDASVSEAQPIASAWPDRYGGARPPADLHPSLGSGGGYCGKGLYLAVIGATLVIACATVGLRAQSKVENLVLRRAETNKVQQVQSLGTLMEASAAVLQDSDRQVSALTELAHSLNREYLRGSMEVVLVRWESNCGSGSCPVRIVTQPRSEQLCPLPGQLNTAARVYQSLPGIDNSVDNPANSNDSSVNPAAPACDLSQVLPIARQVLHGKSGSMRAKDYTMRDVVYAYQPVAGTTVGLIFKQDLDEVMSATDLISKLRWYGGLITYTSTGLVLFLLFAILRQVERGKGRLAQVALCTVAVLGSTAVLFLMAYIETRDEGNMQQLRETGDGAAVLLAGYQALFDADFGTPGMYESIVEQWIATLNPRLDSNFEAMLLRTKVLHGARGENAHDDRFVNMVFDTRRPCDANCTRRLTEAGGLVREVARLAELHPNGHTAQLYDGIGGYVAAGRDERVQRAHETQLEFGWMVKEKYVKDPYGSVVDDLWKHGVGLLCGYIFIAFIASIFVCKLLPDDNAGHHMTSSRRRPWQRLSWMMPLCFICLLSIPMLVIVTASTTALEGIGKVRDAYLVRAHGESMMESAKVAQSLVRQLEAEYRSALIGTGIASDPTKVADVRALAVTALHDVAEKIRWLEGPNAASIHAVRSFEASVGDFFVDVGTRALNAREGATIGANATLIAWAVQPDSTMATAREAINEARKIMNTAGGEDPKGEVHSWLFGLENHLYDLEILLRQEVLLQEGQQEWLGKWNAIKVAYVQMETAMKAEWLIENEGRTAVPAAVRGAMEVHLQDAKDHLDHPERELSNIFEVERQRTLGTLLPAIVEESAVQAGTSSKHIQITTFSGDSKLRIQNVAADQFFDALIQQLDRIGSSARIHVMRHIYVEEDLGVQQDKVLRGVWCSIGCTTLTWIAALVTYWLYVKDAEANTPEDQKGVVDYPTSEIRDFSVLVSLIMVIFFLELAVINQAAKIQLNELEHSNQHIEDAARCSKTVADWNYEINTLLSWSAGYVFVGGQAEKTRFADQWANMQKFEKVGAFPILSASDEACPREDKDRFVAAHNEAIELANRLRGACERRFEFDSTTPTYSYETLKLLVKERVTKSTTQEEFDNWLQENSGAETLKQKTRAKLVQDHCSSRGECGDAHWPAKVMEATGIHDGVASWAPESLSVEAEMAYRLVFANGAENNAPVTLNITHVTSSAAVWKVVTAVSEWIVPYVERVRIEPGHNVTVYLIAVQRGHYDLYERTEQEGPKLGTIIVEGKKTYGVNVGLPLDVEQRLCDPRRQPTHPLWQTSERFDIDLMDTGGYKVQNGQTLQFVEEQGYRIGVHNYEGPGCQFDLLHANRYCQTDQRKDLGDNLTFDVCLAQAALDPECNGPGHRTLAYTNALHNTGDSNTEGRGKCRCVLRGRQCDLLESDEYNDIYQLVCTDGHENPLTNRRGLLLSEYTGTGQPRTLAYDSMYAVCIAGMQAQGQTLVTSQQTCDDNLHGNNCPGNLPPEDCWRQTLDNLKAHDEELSGHVLWSSVEDYTARVEIPFLFSIELRPGALRSARTYFSIVPIDRGVSPLKTLSDPQIPGAGVMISTACYKKLSEKECSSVDALACLWDGAACRQNLKRDALIHTSDIECATNHFNFSQRLSDALWNRLQLRRAAQQLHTHHLAYIISDDSVTDRTRQEWTNEFEQTMAKVQDVGSGLASNFYKWKHMLEVENMVRKNLTGTSFIEDVFQNWSYSLRRGRVHSTKDEVLDDFATLQNAARGSLDRYLHWSHHNTRFIFWSCTAVCWFFTLMAAFLLHRLDIVVTLSNDYSYRNVPQLAANMEMYEDAKGEEEEEEEEGEDEEQEGDEEGEEDD